MTRIRQYHDFTAVGCASPLMEAAIVGLNMPQSYYEEFGAHYAHMKKVFTDGLRSIGIPFTDPEGTYFVLADIAPYLKKGQSDLDFCEQLARKALLKAISGGLFGKALKAKVKVDEGLAAQVEKVLSKQALDAVSLARKAGVGAVPGSSFFSEPVNTIIRLHFAKKDETLCDALDRLSHIRDLL